MDMVNTVTASMVTANTVMESMVMGSTVSMDDMESMVHMVMKISKIPIASRTMGDIYSRQRYTVRLAGMLCMTIKVGGVIACM